MFTLRLLRTPTVFAVDSPLEILALGVDLSLVVEGTQLGHQIGGVLCCVHSQRLGDDEEGAGELGDGQLFPGALRREDDACECEADRGVTPTPVARAVCALLTMLVA